MKMRTEYLSDGSRMTIAAEGWLGGRPAYMIDIRHADGHKIATVDDIRGGMHAPIDLAEGLSAFSSFLSAWVESFDYPGSENAGLFPAAMRDWAEANVEEISIEFDLDPSLYF
jgi:hypothetical protein